MHPVNDNKLRMRVEAAAEEALKRQGYTAVVDVFLGIGWLHPTALDRWRQGRAPSLEPELQSNPSRITEAMRFLHLWATGKGLEPSEAAYVARSPGRPTLRFCEGGDEGVERFFRTHWVSPDLSAKKRERLDEAANRPPELVVISPLDTDWKCHRCGATGDTLDFLIKVDGEPSCLGCAGLGALVFVPTGDALLSRRAKANSDVHAVVVRFSRTRKRFERQGILVHPDALSAAQASIEADAAKKRPAKKTG